MILNDKQKIYLGDRTITKLIFETLVKKISIEFDSISIFETKHWITGESIDIDNCVIEFFDVTDYSIKPLGFTPNDFIVDIDISNHKINIKTLGELYNSQSHQSDIAEGDLYIEFGTYNIND
ncbi:hypothetical protein M2375_002226 [Comamonas sp. BIGb0152]|uniref:DUF6258 family protein n=1 Tax=Comamonas sp. BIGb0152 TaxID=2940601 RepID=UPI00216AB1B8|nr:DUF6258 family protein [Comamonas sp. BIGb0152]MCS4293993.1 hypothetical protein [Comamonas sp. BIGb0152]